MDEKLQDLKSGEVYGLTKTPSIESPSYSAGPTPDITRLLAETPAEDIAAEIHRLYGDRDPDVVYRWDGKTWKLIEDLPKATVEPAPWEHGDGAKLVLSKMGVEEDDDTLMVSCKVERFTVESLVQPQAYEKTRGYAELVPDNLWLHLNVRKPAGLVDEAGNIELLERVFEQVGLALDRAVFQVASQRVDRQTAKKDAETAAKTSRFDAGKGVVPAKKAGEVL